MKLVQVAAPSPLDRPSPGRRAAFYRVDSGVSQSKLIAASST